MLEFKEPLWLLSLIIILPALTFYYFFVANKFRNSIKFSTLSLFSELKSLKVVHFRHIVFILRILTIVALVFALARPRQGKKNTIVKSDGIDLMLCLDVSGSMRGEDMAPNRLTAAKKTIADFIRSRENDRVGLVVFGTEAFLQCPLTHDHGVLLDFLSKVVFIPELENSTAIGMGLARGVLNLKHSKAKSKVIVLLSDGDNNAGEIDPVTAAHLADTFNIKVYTIGLGQPGESQVMVSVPTPFGVQKRPMANYMNEPLLENIAEITGGAYYNALNTAMLQNVYKTIDRLEKTEIESNQYMEYEENYFWFAILALLFFLAERILSETRFRKLP